MASGPASIYSDGRYLSNNLDWHAADGPFKAAWAAELIDRIAPAPKTVVEVGCGSGEMLAALAARYPQSCFAGYDISPQAAGINRAKSARNLEFHQGDLLSTGTQTADLLLAIDVVEHVDDYIGFIRRLRPLARHKLFHIPLDLSVQGLLRNRSMMYARRTIGHLHYFCRDTALATLTDCGYDVVAWRYTHGAVDLPNRKLRTRLLNLPRRLLRAIDEDVAVRVLGGASMMVLAR